MGLSSSEKKMLARLQAKAEEPDTPPVGKSVVYNVDLSNKESVSLAQRLGLLGGDDDDDDDDTSDDDDDTPADDQPKRRGYFEK